MSSIFSIKQWGEKTPQEVKELIDHPEVELIDVREVDEYEAGHIPGIKNIPVSEFTNRIGEIDRNKEVIFVCRSGSRSEMVCQYLFPLGYEKITNMVGGMLEWDGEIEY